MKTWLAAVFAILSCWVVPPASLPSDTDRMIVNPESVTFEKTKATAAK